jgi:hypothetical protein
MIDHFRVTLCILSEKNEKRVAKAYRLKALLSVEMYKPNVVHGGWNLRTTDTRKRVCSRTKSDGRQFILPSVNTKISCQRCSQENETEKNTLQKDGRQAVRQPRIFNNSHNLSSLSETIHSSLNHPTFSTLRQYTSFPVEWLKYLNSNCKVPASATLTRSGKSSV